MLRSARPASVLSAMARRTPSRTQKEPLPTTPRPGAPRQPPTLTPAVTRWGSSLSLPVAASVLALLCLVAYWNSFRAVFLLDNETIILKDPRLRSVDWQSVRDIFTHHYWWPSLESRLFRPVTTLSYWFNYSVLGNGAKPVRLPRGEPAAALGECRAGVLAHPCHHAATVGGAGRRGGARRSPADRRVGDERRREGRPAGGDCRSSADYCCTAGS